MSGRYGTFTVGHSGIAITGNGGKAVAYYTSTTTPGACGTVAAGDGGEICIHWRDKKPVTTAQQLAMSVRTVSSPTPHTDLIASTNSRRWNRCQPIIPTGPASCCAPALVSRAVFQIVPARGSRRSINLLSRPSRPAEWVGERTIKSTKE